MQGIYLHIPFCVKKCHYCDFYSEEIIPFSKSLNLALDSVNIKHIDTFVDYLCKEILLQKKSTNYTKSISTIFFGGGTPSLLTSKHIDRILNLLYKNFHIAENPEITLECNPGTTSREKLSNYFHSGVNRLSFGAQSFVGKELEFLQRIHSPEQISQAVESARIAGFVNINIDLMFSVPGQTIETLLYSLNHIIDLKPEHISSYSLIYEPGTPLYKDFENGKVVKVSDDTDADFYEITKSKLADSGYVQYEVSNYAINADYFCKHNLIYWQGNEYISFGPSSHGFFDGVRYWNHSDNINYYRGIDNGNLPIEGFETLTPKQMLSELIFLGLRSTGINLNRINNEFSYDLVHKNQNYIDELVNAGLIFLKKKQLSLTQKGYSICDEIVLRLLKNINYSDL